jgi:tetratricopeptide (TPR) repeat protein
MTQKRTGRTVRRVPPPLTRSPGHRMLPSAELLAELPEEAALLLWQTCRSVQLWGLAGPRPRLFAPGAAELRRARLEGAGLDDELRAPLALLAALLENRRVVDVPRVVEACREVARWAEGRGKLATALAFAQAAAMAEPEDAGLAVAVGRFARMRAEYERAESWFEHALVLARLTRDWQAYAEAFAGLGNLYVQKGSFPKARMYHQRCLRAAKRYSLHEMEGAALHNLFAVAVESDSYAEAHGFADAALSAYPAGNAGILRLAQDVAFRWVARGEFRPALLVMNELVSRPEVHSIRHIVSGHIARAAGGLDDGNTFESAWSRVWVQLEDEGACAGASSALIGLAYGAISLGEPVRAERALRKALVFAADRKESAALREADHLLQNVRNGAGVPERAAADTSAAERLADRFQLALRGSRVVAPTA